MNIVYASDDDFAEMLGVSIVSLFETNKQCDEIVVYVLDDRISAENRNKLLSVAEKYNRNIIFNPIPDFDKIVGVDFKTNDRWHISAFSRLFLVHILPDDVDKVIYFDCDIIVNGSLEHLYSAELGEYYCGSILDCMSDVHKENVGLRPEDNYFNSGVMLISLEKWRKNDVLELFKRYISRCKGSIPYVDQGVINGTISSKIKPLELKYNVYTVLFDFKGDDLFRYRKPSNFYSAEEVSDAVRSPVVVHFTTSVFSLRPWIENSRHPYAEKWLEYKANSPWANAPLREDTRSPQKKLALKIYNMLPDKLAVSIAGELHSVVIPKIKSAGGK